MFFSIFSLQNDCTKEVLPLLKLFKKYSQLKNDCVRRIFSDPILYIKNRINCSLLIFFRKRFPFYFPKYFLSPRPFSVIYLLQSIERDKSMTQYKTGLFCALGGYILWGVLPIYWKLLGQVGAYEILAHRLIWSFVFMVGLLTLSKLWPKTKELLHEFWTDKKKGLLMISASLLITVNWLVFIWAVTHDRIVESSFGYYINPLVSVCLGLLLFKEKLTKLKWISMGIAMIGISYMTYELGRLPFISLTLALTFAFYGAVKKKLSMNPFISITLETFLSLPLAFYFATTPLENHELMFLGNSSTLTYLLIGAGAVTALPLVLFSAGANRLPLNVLGFCQYLSPTISLLIAVTLYGEPFQEKEIISFSFIWVALVLFTYSDYRH